ncbi:MDR family MFS transporter [Bifidobacterium aquikefiricola]|uniref:MDR family MFS transporter n=1 Tax=Bifidobacterium aquikefiricola TaxID=3059038 RepID=A0AB39U667_9BIFI
MAEQAVSDDTDTDDTNTAHKATSAAGSSGVSGSSMQPGVWSTVWATLIGGLAVLFGTTIISVAIKPLAVALNAPVSTIQWVSTAYLLMLGVTIPLDGWAQRRFGGKRLWITGLVIFMIASILSSLSWNAAALIVFRGLQGVGGGILMPLMLTLVMQAAHGRNIGKIMSVVSMPAILGPILGPVLGGLILDHLAWPWLFWVNVPFCVVGIILAIVALPKDGPTHNAPLDIPGFILMAAGLVGVLYGLSNASSAGGFGAANVLVPLVGGAILLVAFVWWALIRREKALVDIRLLKHWPLASASSLLFLSGFALYGAMLLLPLYFQTLRGLTPLQAGLMLIPQGLGTFASRSIAGNLTDSIGARWVTVVGFAILTLGTVPFAFADANTSYIWIGFVLFVRGIGLGAVTLPLMAVAYQGLAPKEVPDASLFSRIGQQVGGSFGAAVLVVILESAAGNITQASQASGAFQTSFWWTTGFTVFALVLSFWLPGAPATPKTEELANEEDAEL